MGRDQKDNAVRVVHHGAGLRLSTKATPQRIADALSEVVDNNTYRSGARRLSSELTAEAANADPVTELEALVATVDNQI